MGKYKDWKEYFKEKNKYSNNNPLLFYDLIAKYLPEDESVMIIDVGCGKTCEFETYLGLWTKYKHLYVLDNNPTTINELKDRLGYGLKAEVYTAPAQLPGFGDKSVDFIYSSHMIEHLPFMDVYKLLKEFDRVLKPTGILVLRTAMMWYAFYETFDHIKPYPPLIFKQYLCGSYVDSPSYQLISKDYKVKELVYRYNKFSSNNSKIGSSIKLFDFLIQSMNQFVRNVLKIKRYKQTGYTMILRKNGEK